MTRRRRAHRYSNIACGVISVVGFLVTLPWQEALHIWNEGVPVFSVQTPPQIMVGNLFAASLECGRIFRNIRVLLDQNGLVWQPPAAKARIILGIPC